MKKALQIFFNGVLSGAIIALCQSMANVMVYVHDSRIPITVFNLSQYSMMFLVVFGISFFLYSSPCILGIVFLHVLLKHSQVYITGLFAGLVTGIVVSIPFLLARLGVFNTLLFPLDLINVLISVMVFGFAGLIIFKKRDWSLSKAKTLPPPSPTNAAQAPASTTPKKRYLGLWLLTGMVATLLVVCVSLVLVVTTSLFSSYSTKIADQIWSYRITQKLEENGYEIENVSIIRDPENNILSRMEVRIDRVKSKEYMEYQDIVMDAYEVVFEMADPPIFKPKELGEIDVSWMNGNITIDYEYARRFVQHQISRGEFIQHWRFY